MSESQPQSISRRSALAGLGAGYLGFAFAAHAAAQSAARPNRETGSAPGDLDDAIADARAEILSTLGHPLSGMWLSTMGSPSNPNITITVPSFFGADGSLFLCFPGTEASKQGIRIKGPAMGAWEPVDERSGHFTAVQVLADFDGNYVGTVTLDGYPTIGEDGEGYEVGTDQNVFTFRDALNEITETLTASASNPMRGLRLRPGNAGFPASTLSVPGQPPKEDPRTPD